MVPIDSPVPRVQPGRRLFVLFAFVLVSLLSCGDDTIAPDRGGGGGGSSFGRLTLNVVGLPDGLSAAIDVVGPADSFRVTGTTTLEQLAPGTYDLSALDVIDPVLPVAWQPTLSASQVAVTAGQTAAVAVTYDSVSTLVRVDLRTGDGYDGVYAEWNNVVDRPVLNGAGFVSSLCGSGWEGGFSLRPRVVLASSGGSQMHVNFDAASSSPRTIAISWNGDVSPPLSPTVQSGRADFNEMPYNYFYGDIFNPHGDSLLVTIEGRAMIVAHTPVGGTSNVARVAASASVDVRECGNNQVYFIDLYRLSSQVSGDSLSAFMRGSFRTRATRLLLRIHDNAALIGRYDPAGPGYVYSAYGSGSLMINVSRITP